KPPFEGDAHALIEQHMESLPSPLKEKQRGIPKSVERLVMFALAKNPSARPASALAFATALRANSEGVGLLLRQAFTFSSEHFPTFIRASLIGYIPFLIFIFLLPSVVVTARWFLLGLFPVLSYFPMISPSENTTTLSFKLFCLVLLSVILANTFSGALF